MSHEVQSTFGVSCPNSTGSFYVCEDKPIRFVGCCTIDPCKTDDGNCPDDELVGTSFDALSYSQLQKQDCLSDDPDIEWYTCAYNDPPFMGCCARNPCAEGSCPRADLSQAILNEDPDLASVFLPEGYFSSGLSTGAKAGIAVGSVIGGLAIIAAGAWWYRRRKNRREHEASLGTYAPPGEKGGHHQHGGNGLPNQPHSPDPTMLGSPRDKGGYGSGQPSPYADTFMSSPSMHHHGSHNQHLSWEAAQSNASFATTSPYIPGQSPPLGQGGFPPSAYVGAEGYHHLGQQQQQHYYQQQYQQPQPVQELPGADGDMPHASELASTTDGGYGNGVRGLDDEVSRVSSPPRERGLGVPPEDEPMESPVVGRK